MTYEYKCKECGYTEDKELSIHDKIPSSCNCPKCKKKTLNRVWTSGIHIPDNFKATEPFKYDKRPSRKKKFF